MCIVFKDSFCVAQSDTHGNIGIRGSAADMAVSLPQALPGSGQSKKLDFQTFPFTAAENGVGVYCKVLNHCIIS
jgi:hypothetical protein